MKYFGKTHSYVLQEKVLALIECAVRWKKGDATGDGWTTDSDDVELVKGDVTG